MRRTRLLRLWPASTEPRQPLDLQTVQQSSCQPGQWAAWLWWLMWLHQLVVLCRLDWLPSAPRHRQTARQEEQPWMHCCPGMVCQWPSLRPGWSQLLPSSSRSRHQQLAAGQPRVGCPKALLRLLRQRQVPAGRQQAVRCSQALQQPEVWKQVLAGR